MLLEIRLYNLAGIIFDIKEPCASAVEFSLTDMFHIASEKLSTLEGNQSELRYGSCHC